MSQPDSATGSVLSLWRDTAPPPAAQLARALAVLVAVLLLQPQPVVLPLVRAFQAGQAAGASQDYGAAADAWAESAQRLPYSSQALYQAALAEISAGRFEAAVGHLKAAAALDGWTAARRIALGDAYTGLGDTTSAVDQWEQALADQPGDDALLARLANSYEALGRYPDALRVLRDLVGLRPGDSAARYRLALVSAAAEPESAMSALSLAGDLAPELKPALQPIIDSVQTGAEAGDRAYTFGLVGYSLIQLKEWGLAEFALTTAVTLNPSYADAHAYLGLAQDMGGKDGQSAYETAVALAPESAMAQYLLGLHWRRQGDSQAALPYLKAAEALDSKNPALAAELGGAYAALGDLTAAEAWLTQAVSLDSQNAEFWLLLARFYVDNDFHVAEAGLPAARMAVGLAPQSALAADALGYALVVTGDLVNGAKMLERALALDGQQSSIFLHLGLLYTRQGRRAEAEAALNHALALDPEGYYGGLALRALSQLP
jgi:tetratricopeptide (TPR) repeat protein